VNDQVQGIVNTAYNSTSNPSTALLTMAICTKYCKIFTQNSGVAVMTLVVAGSLERGVEDPSEVERAGRRHATDSMVHKTTPSVFTTSYSIDEETNEQ